MLQLGSITCPAYDINIKKMLELKSKYSDSVDFYTVYVRENHPSKMYPAHSSFKQKVKFAKKLISEDKIDQDVLVDDVQGTFHQSIGNFGNSIYVIGKDLRLAHWSMFTEPNLVEKGIINLLKNKGISNERDFVGGTDIHPIAFDQYGLEEKKSTFKKMLSRSGTGKISTPEKELSILKKYEEFSHLGEDHKKSITNLIHALTSKEKNPIEKGKAMLEFQKKFRTEYSFRFEKWKQANHINKSAGLKTQINNSN